MIRLKYILLVVLLSGIFISLEDHQLILRGYHPVMACDEDDFDDDFDYDDYDDDDFDYWLDDSHAGNADAYWDTFDSFVCIGTAPSNDDDDYEEDDDPWWEDEEDPCDNGACETDEDTNNDDEPRDCAGVAGGDAYVDKCGECVGGNTGKTACKDCSGVENGLSYYIRCKNDSVCVNGNVGMFDSQLNQQHQQIFDNVLSELQSNCWTNAMLRNINKNSGIKISMGNHPDYPGVFEPCDHGISIDSLNSISAYSLTAELFHAFQDQIWNGKLREIKLDTEHNHIGGSNMEAEEKAMGKISFMWNGLHYTTAFPKLDQWIDQYMEYHISNKNCELSDEELASWYAAVKEFSEINQSMTSQTGTKDMYSSPVDYSLPPQGLITICNSIAPSCKPELL